MLIIKLLIKTALIIGFLNTPNAFAVDPPEHNHENCPHHYLHEQVKDVPNETTNCNDCKHKKHDHQCDKHKCKHKKFKKEYINSTDKPKFFKWDAEKNEFIQMTDEEIKMAVQKAKDNISKHDQKMYLHNKKPINKIKND